ncbi:polysaccharide deacetylase family protein [Pseudoxanthomonas indica]|uniref:Polysaccharide deacetylase n=1 Tax=Pseudoxanthomonas indica TaxID=428993 RepID=A0A1T5L949_9GAMM|nr:polysaccharide deacetylase family protein [Pseudoxanthomonas indica]GGD32169.1 polysaccharide deacetylase [Pseudoxanthomonas indica]SKC72464.1 Polysaccharide deacetylase [Pseudoxanthomonas indica]
MSKRLRAGLGMICLLSSLCVHAQAVDRRIAVTIDDLPWQRIGQTPEASLPAQHAALLAQLRQAGVPVVGFVNEDKLEIAGQVAPQRLSMLQDWLDAGYELGNHTYGHVDLHEVGLPAFEDAILRGERQLRPLLAERGQMPRYFRHPYLRAGRTPQERAALSGFLGEHGYRIVPVTVDNGEWVWAFAYARVLEQQPAGAAREATLRQLRRGYVPYMLNKLDYFEHQSQALLGYALPQIWLMHANELNAVCYAELVAAAQRRGYRFITVEEALRDPAYARGEAGYDGRFGPSWLHRWAMAENKPRTFYAGEPEVPKWVLDLAGLEGE